ncbi:MAG: DUF262 domain-containing protein [Kiritimatiellae bacterium]|nr:DUF262 domain-containing protein [Kiritimatiellia bacterium]
MSIRTTSNAAADALDLQISTMRNSLKADRLDMSFGEIIATYERGELIIDPEFQRLFRWKIDQRTRFLESILLGIPIPPVFVAEDQRGRWELVDGLQRISTILSFFGELRTAESKRANGWVLQKGDLIPALEGFNFNTLPSKYLLNIKRAVCRVEIIKWDSKWDMRYELFSRLNTGGSPLTEQEIRNSIFRSGLKRLYAFVDEIKHSGGFKALVDVSERRREKLFDDELIIRFLALAQRWQEIDGTIAEYTTKYMRDMLKNKEDLDPKTECLFRQVLHLLGPLGSGIFRARSTFSASLYDAIMIATAENVDYFNRHPDVLSRAIDALRKDKTFRELRGGASSKTRTRVRISHAVELFHRLIATEKK